MTQKKKHTIKGFSLNDVPKLDENLNDLYRSKIESLNLYDASASGAAIRIFQSIEHGYAYFSANGSAVTTRSFPIRSQFEQVIYANAHARHSAITARVTDITASSITIDAVAVSASGGAQAFSLTTTASVTIYWQIIGSAP
jgi:hypothetical protein